MKFLAFVTPTPDIYHGCSTWKTLWEEKFTLVNMTSCGGRNVRKNREIKNGKKYIILDISSNIYCLDKKKVTSSESKDRMGIQIRGLLHLWLSVPNGQTRNKRKGFPLLTLLITTSGSCSDSLRINII